MKPSQLIQPALDVASSSLEPSKTITFIAVLLVLALVAITWRIVDVMLNILKALRPPKR